MNKWLFLAGHFNELIKKTNFLHPLKLISELIMILRLNNIANENYVDCVLLLLLLFLNYYYL